MKKDKLHNDELATPLLSMEDVEKDVFGLRSFTARPNSDQGGGTEDLNIRQSMLSSKSGSRLAHSKESFEYAGQKDDILIDFARAKAQIEKLKDELMKDYLKDKMLMGASKVLDVQKLKTNKDTMGHEHITDLMDDKVQLPDEKVALEYSETLPDEKIIPGLTEKLSDNTAITEYTGKVSDDRANHGKHGKLNAQTVSEYSEKWTDNKDASEILGKLANNKAVSEYDEKLLGDKLASTYEGEMGSRNGDLRQEAHNSLDHDNRNNYYSTGQLTDSATQTQNHESQLSSSEMVHNQLEIDLFSPEKQKETAVWKGGYKPNSDGELSFESSAPIELTAQESVGNSVDGILDTSNSKTSEIISKTSQEYGDKMFIGETSPDKKTETPNDRFKNNLSMYLSKIMSNTKIKEQSRRKNQTVLIHNNEQIDYKGDRKHGFSASSGQKSVSLVSQQTHALKHMDRPESTTGSSRNLSGDDKEEVSVEKRRGNMAAKYRNKNKKTHHKQRPKPQPTVKPQPVMTLDTTTRIQTASTSENILANLTNDTSGWTTTGQPNRTMEEIIDTGSDRVDIPLSGTPAWHTLIHGRRDIVLAGAVMGGIGLLLIMLSIIYMFVNRKSSQPKTNKNNSKSYQRLGTEDEKVRLTKTKHSLISLSSEDETSEESHEDIEQRGVKKKKAGHN